MYGVWYVCAVSKGSPHVVLATKQQTMIDVSNLILGIFLCFVTFFPLLFEERERRKKPVERPFIYTRRKYLWEFKYVEHSIDFSNIMLWQDLEKSYISFCIWYWLKPIVFTIYVCVHCTDMYYVIFMQLILQVKNCVKFWWFFFYRIAVVCLWCWWFSCLGYRMR